MATAADLPGSRRSATDVACRLEVELRIVQRALRRGYLDGEKRGNAWAIPEATLAQLAAAGPHPFRAMAPSHPAAWMPGFMSAAAAARELSVTAGYVGALVRGGHLDARRVGVWLAVSEASVARFDEQRRAAEEDAESAEIRRLILGGTPIPAPTLPLRLAEDRARTDPGRLSPWSLSPSAVRSITWPRAGR